MINPRTFLVRLVPLAKRNRSTLIRVGVVGAVLCGLPVVGYLMTRQRFSALVLAALAATFGLLAVARRLELGIVAMLLAGFLVRFRIATGTKSEIVISLVIAAGCIALWIIRMLVMEKRLALKPAPTDVPLLAFMVTVGVSWAWSRAFRDPLVREVGHPLVSVAAGLVMVLLPGCFLLAANNIRDVRWLRALVWIVLIEGLIALFIDLAPRFGLSALWPVYRFLRTSRFIFVNTHGLLSMWCTSFALALALFDRRLNRVLRILLLVYVGAWVYWGYFLRIAWLAGWVPAFAAAAAIAFLRSRWLFVVVAVAIVVGAGGHYWGVRFQDEFNISGITRLAAYKANWRITGKHWLFGTGPAGYASYYMSYFPTQAMASHSNYIDTIAQTGIVGTFFILWFFGAQAWGGYRLRLRLKGRGDFAESLSVAVFAGTAGCVIAMALGDWVLPFTYTQGIIGFDLALFSWLFMGSLWALRYNLASEGMAENALQRAEEAVA